MRISTVNNFQILTPYKFYAEYENGVELYFYGNNEEECIQEIANQQEEYGNCIFYTGVCDKDYVSGEYIGEDNFIY